MPSGLSSITSRACLRVEIVFEDRVYVIDLICIPMKGIDVIVGMDWLAANNATLNYARKLVSLPVSLAGTNSTEQLRLLLVMRDEKLVNQGCDAYMVVYMDSNIYDGGIEKIRVASEFLKVFSEEMFGLPPKREVEFSKIWYRTNF
ncbi:uncharacterized protein LOC129308906 [Prosopis cineraria]|uniref:uncharacterized protein LOC129308906 n=1 Tax=Prosopis cineraria TaxID=364024 RepID=UPI00240F8309|nr:uncharacterized protein LOC129308906 [Prosopis cineraria]